MRMMAALAAVAVALCGAWARAEAPKGGVKPQKEHEWLKQLEGEWVNEAEMVMGPGKPAMKSKGTETARSLGGLWSVNEIKAEVMGASFTGIMTVGYDTRSRKYVGTWVCSMCDHQCRYVGHVKGQVLTLETEAPNPEDGGKLVKMKDVIEIKDRDHKVMTSWAMGKDGKWVKFMTVNSRRKK